VVASFHNLPELRAERLVVRDRFRDRFVENQRTDLVGCCVVFCAVAVDVGVARDRCQRCVRTRCDTIVVTCAWVRASDIVIQPDCGDADSEKL